VCPECVLDMLGVCVQRGSQAGYAWRGKVAVGADG
jgi:hypothetical protein